MSVNIRRCAVVDANSIPNSSPTRGYQQCNIMALLRASIIGLIALTGVSYSQDLNLGESLYPFDEKYLGYRPWEQNDTSTTWVSFDQMGITSLKSLVRMNIKNLEWLVMDNNQIQSIPAKAFAFLPELTYISLARNLIGQFYPDAFSSLKNLQALDLDENPIPSNLDTNVFNSLPALQSLYLRFCQLKSFYLPEHTSNLSNLYLSGNQLQIFNANKKSAVTRLVLNNNHLSYVSLVNLESLIYLDLRGNWLDKIMSQSLISVSQYSVTLNSMWYYRATTHSALYLDYAPALEYLVLSYNRISVIGSDSFLGTESLIYVDLGMNKIGELYPGTFNNLLQLETIVLDSNEIEQINYRVFVNLPNLKTLSLKNNNISDVDEDAFTKLNSRANEVFLHLDNNEIQTLKSGSFRGINGLKYIGLSNNKIKTILKQAFVNLPNLEFIAIENQLRDKSAVSEPSIGFISSHAFSNLTNLTAIKITGNEFTDIEAQAFEALPKLWILDLSNNSIEYLSPEAFHELPEIGTLYLSDNFLSQIAPGTFPKQLKHLDLARNNKCPDFSCWHIEELRQLEELDISDAVDRFRIEDLEMFPKNLTVVM